MSSPTYSQFISINSQDRNAGGTPTNFTIPINPIAKPTKATLLWASIPYTMYNIQEGVNDSLVLGDPNGPIPIQIPAQYYSAPALATILSHLLSTAGTQAYTVTYSPNTFKLTVTTATTPFTLDFSVANSCAAVLGFNPTITSSALAHTGDKVIDLGESSLFIDIAELSTGVYNHSQPHTFMIPITVNAGSSIQLQSPPSVPQIVNVPSSLYQLTIKLVKANREVVDLNGAEWQILLQVDYQ